MVFDEGGVVCVVGGEVWVDEVLCRHLSRLAGVLLLREEKVELEVVLCLSNLAIPILYV